MKMTLLLTVFAAMLLSACACCKTMDSEKIKSDAHKSFNSMDNPK